MKCKKCGSIKVDIYGCLQCWMDACNQAMWKRIEAEENGNV